jgi:GNAT superfamily N-acetyltransferase
MEISPLKNHPSAIPIVARWLFGQWGGLTPDSSLEKYTRFAQDGARDDGLPLTWVALSGSRVVGTASLAEYDIHTRKDLSPWLVSVYVNVQDRGQGIGSVLVRHVVEQARALGIKELWLFTPDKEHFYRRLGWQTVESTRYRGEEVVIMKLELDVVYD